MNKGQSRAAIWAAPIIFFGVLFYWPLGKILSIGFGGRWFSSVATAKIASILWFTVWQAGLSAILSLVFGIPGAYILYRRSFPGQKILRALITVPFMLPTIVVAIGFTAFRTLPFISQWNANHAGVPILISANIFMNYSLAVRIIGSVWSKLDPSIEDAAELDGSGRFRTFISISLPQLANAIGSAATLIFLYCSANFGLVLVLGGASTKTLETEIYISATQYLDLPKASGLVLMQTLLTILAFAIAQRVSQGHMDIVGATSLSLAPRIDRRDKWAVATTFVFIFVVILFPLGAVFVKAFHFAGKFTLLNFANLGSHGARDVLSISVGHAALNTVRNAIFTTALSMLVGLTISYLLSRPRTTPRSKFYVRAMDIFFQMPAGISSVVLGLGYLACFSSGFFPLRSSWLVTPIAQSLLTTPLVIRLIYPALAHMDADLRECAETEAADSSQIWWLIEVPIVKDVLLIATGYATVISIGEFGAANFLAYGDQGTLPTVLYQLISRPGEQNYGMAMAASALLIGTAFLIVYLANMFERDR